MAKENAGIEKKVAQLLNQVSRLEGKMTIAKKKADELEKRKNRLADDVQRLEQIKSDYLERISKFKMMREELIK